jgi:uncharacterized damage-inducible protein DinB
MPDADLLIDGFGRVREVVYDVLDGLTDEELMARLDRDANSISWLIWHLTRVQDDHVAAGAGLGQVWQSGWEEQFGLPLDPLDIGYGHTSAEVALVRCSRDLLAEYHEATYDQTVAYLGTLTDADMESVVDKRWDPPVTLAVRLVSVISDDLQHAGQAAFVKGILKRR